MNINTVFKVSRVFNLRDNVGLDYWWEQRARTRMATTSPWDQKVINVSHKKRREESEERRAVVGGCDRSESRLTDRNDSPYQYYYL